MFSRYFKQFRIKQVPIYSRIGPEKVPILPESPFFYPSTTYFSTKSRSHFVLHPLHSNLSLTHQSNDLHLAQKYKVPWGKGSEEEKNGKIVPFWQTPLGHPLPGLPFFPRKKIDHYFFLKMNHWCVKRILHLVPFKNLYICFWHI